MKSEMKLAIILIFVGGLAGVLFDWTNSYLGFSGILLIILGIGIGLKTHVKLKMQKGVLLGVMVLVIGVLIVFSGQYHGHNMPKFTGYIISVIGMVIAIESHRKS